VPAPLQAPLPPYFTLDDSYTLSFTAQDPTDGSLVAGVIISNASLAVDNVVGGAGNTVAPFPLLVPGT
jgi:hypothetical protein